MKIAGDRRDVLLLRESSSVFEVGVGERRWMVTYGGTAPLLVLVFVTHYSRWERAWIVEYRKSPPTSVSHDSLIQCDNAVTHMSSILASSCDIPR